MLGDIYPGLDRTGRLHTPLLVILGGVYTWDAEQALGSVMGVL